jgi:hypothetical protein
MNSLFTIKPTVTGHGFFSSDGSDLPTISREGHWFEPSSSHINKEKPLRKLRGFFILEEVQI